jgi:hypothetical protein
MIENGEGRRTEAPPVLERVGIHGFKAVLEADVEIRPLTILAGANSSGKSSLMQPLLLMKQTLEAGYDPGALLLDGPNATFTHPDEILHRRKGVAADAFRVTTAMSVGGTVTTEFRRDKAGLTLVATVFDVRSAQARLTDEMSDSEIRAVLPKPPPRIRKLLDAASLEVVRYRCFHAVAFHPASAEQMPLLYPLFEPAALAAEGLRSLLHVPGLRGNPERTYHLTSAGPGFVGTFVPYVASVLLQWQADKDPRCAAVSAHMGSMGLTCRVRAKQRDATRVELRVGRTCRALPGADSDLVNIADVGFGVSQVLPVVVALVAADPGQAVYIEQPEIHLHPRAQLAMAAILAEAAKRGVRVVVETHSDLLLLAVQTLVAEGKLDPALVKLHWFARDDDGVTTVTSRDLDADGSYGDWPEDFTTVDLRAQNAYLDASEQHLFGALHAR